MPKKIFLENIEFTLLDQSFIWNLTHNDESGDDFWWWNILWTNSSSAVLKKINIGEEIREINQYEGGFVSFDDVIE